MTLIYSLRTRIARAICTLGGPRDLHPPAPPAGPGPRPAAARAPRGD